jgi:hypothetical protein
MKTRVPEHMACVHVGCLIGVDDLCAYIISRFAFCG